MEELAFWRNVAIVVLCLQGLVLLVVVLALNYLLVRLMNSLHSHARTYAFKAQELSHKATEQADAYAAKARRPVVAAQKRGAQLQTALRVLAGRPQSPSSMTPSQPQQRDSNA